MAGGPHHVSILSSPHKPLYAQYDGCPRDAQFFIRTSYAGGSTCHLAHSPPSVGIYVMSFLDRQVTNPDASANRISNAIATMPRVAMVGTYPPKRCGIATYTADMRMALESAGACVNVIAIDDRADSCCEESTKRFCKSDQFAYLKLADEINSRSSVALLQHEFGIYGGVEGVHFLLLLRHLKVPAVVVIHTVPSEPNAMQRRILQEILDRSSCIFVMSRVAQAVLESEYRSNPGLVCYVPHGVPEPLGATREASKAHLGWDAMRVVLTFGLLSPTKGIEYAIEAFGQVADSHPETHYVIAGQTHPNVRSESGECYRESLERLACEKGLESRVHFIDEFVDIDRLRHMLNAADVYVTPSLEPAQVTSGTLSYAIGAGRAIVSTRYVHSMELLGDGTGLLVPIRDANSIANSLDRVLGDEALQRSLESLSSAKAVDMTWAACGREVLGRIRASVERTKERVFCNSTSTLSHIVPEAISLNHLSNLTDEIGTVQHCCGDVPELEFGYCTDDCARVLTLVQTLRLKKPFDSELARIEMSTLGFIADSWNAEIRQFRNFMDGNGLWKETFGSPESQSRAIAALARSATIAVDSDTRDLSLALLNLEVWPLIDSRSPRVAGNLLCALADLIPKTSRAGSHYVLGDQLVDRLSEMLTEQCKPNWMWIEPVLTYDNARIAEGLIRYARTTNDPDAGLLGLRLLRWLDAVQTGPGSIFVPIGNEGFYESDGGRAVFDQQPIEAASMVLACQAAMDFDGDPSWLEVATKAFSWFQGNNVVGVPVADSMGSFDGLTATGPSINRGAESTWAYLMAWTVCRAMRVEVDRMESRRRTGLNGI